MAIEIVDLPIKNGGSFHSYVAVRGSLEASTIRARRKIRRRQLDGNRPPERTPTGKWGMFLSSNHLMFVGYLNGSKITESVSWLLAIHPTYLPKGLDCGVLLS